MYECKVDVDMLNAIKSVLTDVSSEQRARRANALKTSANTLCGVQHIHINLTLIHCTLYRHADADQN